MGDTTRFPAPGFQQCAQLWFHALCWARQSCYPRFPVASAYIQTPTSRAAASALLSPVCSCSTSHYRDVYHFMWGGRGSSSWLCFQHFVFFMYHCYVFRVHIYSAILTGWAGLNYSYQGTRTPCRYQSPKKAYQAISNGIHRTPARTLREVDWDSLG